MNKKVAISAWFKYGHSISLVNLEHTKCFQDMSYEYMVPKDLLCFRIGFLRMVTIPY